MDTLIFLGLIPIIGFVIAFYLDATKPKRTRKEKKQWEEVLGVDFNLEEIVRYHIEKFGKYETKSNYKNIVDFMNKVDKNTSMSSDIYKKYFN